MDTIEIFPARQNVGKDIVTPLRVTVAKAEKLVATKLWAYTPEPTTKDDVKLLVSLAKQEVLIDAQNNKAEAERLRIEREELEALRAELMAKSEKSTKKAV